MRRGQLRPGPRPAPRPITLSYLGYLRVDALSAIFLLATAFLYAAVSVYSIGYVRHHGRGDHYARRFYAGLNLFAWAMLAAPLMSSLALLWIAVEITTIISALLVAIEDTDGAAEAAWKYVLIASAGLGLGLLATVFAYYAGSQVLGEHYNLAIEPLIAVGARCRTPRSGSPSCWRCSATEPRSACSRCTPGCRTRIPRRPPRCPRAVRVAAAVSSTRSCGSTSSPPRPGQRLPAGSALLAFGVASLLLAALPRPAGCKLSGLSTSRPGHASELPARRWRWPG